MKVVKFGGSSGADATQLHKVKDIIVADEHRRIIVVSAPGKRFEEDMKVTDLLVAYYYAAKNRQDVMYYQSRLIHRYQSMISDLTSTGEMSNDVAKSLIGKISDRISSLATIDLFQPFALDTFKAMGEDCQAILLTSYLREAGLDAGYVSPEQLGLLVTPIPGRACVSELTYEQLKTFQFNYDRIVVPGFFGVTNTGERCTFERGGSDITGSILAAAYEAYVYENFTDVDGVFAAHPKWVSDAQCLKYLSYDTMERLSYAGFEVLHPDAIAPVRTKAVPINIKNTNNPMAEGTWVSDHQEEVHSLVQGVSLFKQNSSEAIIRLIGNGLSDGSTLINQGMQALSTHGIRLLAVKGDNEGYYFDIYVVKQRALETIRILHETCVMTKRPMQSVG